LKSKAVLIAVAISLSLIIAGQVFYIYRQHIALQTMSNLYATLKEDYEALEQKHASLTSEHFSLESEHNALVSDHELLQSEYGSLESQNQYLESRYDNIKDNYEKLRDNINQRIHPSNFSDFITPKDSAISPIVMQVTGGWSDQTDWGEYWEDIKKMYDWVRNNIEYRGDCLYPLLPIDPTGSIQWIKSAWQFSNETLKLREGDCEDMAILLCSMIRHYSGEKYWAEVILIKGSRGAHAGVQSPVGEDKLTILDPTGNYYTKTIFGSIDSREISTEINNWLNFWETSLGDDVYVYRVFANYLDKAFSSTKEYISWMHARV